ncbi:MAG: hypothetical protein ACW98I_03650 [Candidatus Hodarchaeales archaeon]|jgi:hypothetical protein
MVSNKNNLLLIFVGLLLILSIFTTGKGTINQVSSSVSIPSVGLVATWVTGSGFNETVEIMDENSTHFFLEFYPDDPTPVATIISKDVWLDYTYLWDFAEPMGWAGWISTDGLTVGEYITLGNELVEVIKIDNLTIPLGTFPVFVVNTTDGRLYNYHATSGILLGYDDGTEFHYLLATNGDINEDLPNIDLFVPFVGFRAVYLFQGDNGTILLNESIIVTGENASHYFVDNIADGVVIDHSFVSKLIWMDRVYRWTFVSVGIDLGWPLWINVTEISLGENVTLGMESFQVVDKVHITVPVSDFEVWNVSRPHENNTYWYEVNSGLLIAYAFSDEYHYLDTTNIHTENGTSTTTIVTTIETTTPETTIPGSETTVITSEPKTTDPLIDNSTTTSTKESTSSVPDSTTSDDDLTTTKDSTAPKISPGFTLPVVITIFGTFYWINTSRKK